jgi:integrase
VLYEGRDAAGRRKYRWYSGYSNEKDAGVALTAKLFEQDQGSYVEPHAKLTVRRFLEGWLEDYARINVAPRTFEGYEHIIRRHLIPELGPIVLAKLTSSRIQAYYSDKMRVPRLASSKPKPGVQRKPLPPLSPRTVRHHHVTLHGALQTAVKRGLLPRNPADATDPPKFERPEMRTFEEAGLRTFLAAARETPYYSLFYLSLFTGMRRSEVLAIRWQDVDLNLAQIQVRRSMHRLRGGAIVFREPKTAKSRRLVALPPSAALVLREHFNQEAAHRAFLESSPIAAADLVFAHLDGTPMQPDSITHAWRKLAQRTGFAGVRLHDARHTHASLLLKQGVHPKIVQERLGHATIATTLDIYSHVTPGMQEAAALRFDEVLDAGGAPAAVSQT